MEVSPQPSQHAPRSAPAQKRSLSTTLMRLSVATDAFLQDAFYSLGHRIYRRPLLHIVVCVFVALVCAAGFSRLKVESNPERLYTPQDSRRFDDRAYIESVFGFDDRPTFIFATAGRNAAGGNLLTRQGLLALLDLYERLQNVTIVYEGVSYDYRAVCIKPILNGPCEQTSVLDIWNYSRAAIEADTNVLDSLNTRSRQADAFGQPLRMDDIVGGVTTNASDYILSARALKFTVNIRNQKVPISGESDNDPVALRWEREVVNLVRGYSDPAGQLVLFPLNDQGEGDEFDSAINADVALLTLGYILLILYTLFVFCRRNAVHSHSWLSLPCVLAVGLAVVSSFGLGLAMGIRFSLVVNTLAFVLLGIGVDDAYVIMGSLQLVSNKLPKEERIAKALAISGASITVTSLTDVIAFLCGSYTSLPALQSFCWFASLGCFFLFVYQCIFFTAFVVYDLQRVEANRRDIFCCFKVAQEQLDKTTCSDKVFNPEEPTAIRKFFGTTYSDFVLSVPGKILILLATFGFIAGGIVGIVNLRSEFNIEWFAPSDSYLQDVYETRDAFFRGNNLPFVVITREGDYFANEAELQALGASVRTSEFVVGPSVQYWYDGYRAWLNATRASELVNGRAPNATAFSSWLGEFLTTPDGSAFRSSIVFVSPGEPAQGVRATRMRGLFRPARGSTQQIRNMRGLDRAAETPAPSLRAFAYSFPYLFFEGQEVIVEETIRNVISSSIGVFVVVLILLASFPSALIVLSLVAIIDMQLLGFVDNVGYTYNSVITINLILAVGLAVDYSAHIMRAFLSAKGSRAERTRSALSELGESVLHGGISTFLAVVVMAGAVSYVFRVFFAMFALIVLFGQFAGLATLPVVLSIAGPPSYAELREELERERGAVVKVVAVEMGQQH